MANILSGLFGPMGSGKSYEAMAFHVLPAFAAGQVVATNIKGLDADQQLAAIAEYTGRTVEQIKAQLVPLPNTRDELFRPGLFPDPLDWTKKSVIPPGSLVVLDECSTIFNKEPPEHILRYITEQRHGVDKAGNVGRMVIISQSSKIHYSVRMVMSVAYLFSKFSMLEPFMKILRPLKLGADYRAEVYTDMAKTIGRSKPDNLISRRYDLRVFPTYKSVDAEEFKRLGLDKRQTLLGNRWFTLFLPLMLIFALWSGSNLLSKFGGAINKKDEVASTATPATSSNSSAVPVPLKAPDAYLDQFSKDWRLVGTSAHGGTLYYVIQHSTGRYRYTTIADLKAVDYRGADIVLTMKNGERVDYQSGKGVSSVSPSTSASAAGYMSKPS